SEPKRQNSCAKVDSKKRLPCLGLREHAVKVGPCRKVLRVQSTRWVLRRPSELAAETGHVRFPDFGGTWTERSRVLSTGVLPRNNFRLPRDSGTVSGPNREFVILRDRAGGLGT